MTNNIAIALGISFLLGTYVGIAFDRDDFLWWFRGKGGKDE